MAKTKKKPIPKGKHMMNGRMMSDAEMEGMMPPKGMPKKKTKKRGAKRGR